MTSIDTAREWVRVARDKHEHYEKNVAPNWPANPTAVSVHEQSLVKTVPHLVEQIETLLAELDRRLAVVDAAEQVIAAGQLSLDTPGVDVETIQHSAFTRLAEAVEALCGGAPVLCCCELERARQDGRNAAADAIEQMPYELGDAGWRALEEKAREADYPVEWVRRRRQRNDFTTATIEVAYQYGYRQAAKVVRSKPEVTPANKTVEVVNVPDVTR